MPQNEHIEQAQKRHGKRLDTEERLYVVYVLIMAASHNLVDSFFIF